MKLILFIILEFKLFQRQIMNSQPNNPLHGVTLEKMLTQLVDHYDWKGLAEIFRMDCFHFDPSIKSCLKFLRKTPWAREKIEELYLDMMDEL
jgi:uncharacterized protein (DUF2132 family)